MPKGVENLIGGQPNFSCPLDSILPPDEEPSALPYKMYIPLDMPLELTFKKTVECTWIICFNLICPVHHDAEVSEMIALTGNILPVHTYPLIRYRIITKFRYTVHI